MCGAGNICLCFCGCVHMCKHVGVPVKPEVSVECLLQSVSTLIFETCSLTPLEIIYTAGLILTGPAFT